MCPVQTEVCRDECVLCMSGKLSSEAVFSPQGCLSFESTLSFRCKSRSKALCVRNQLHSSIAGTTAGSNLAKVSKGKSVQSPFAHQKFSETSFKRVRHKLSVLHLISFFSGHNQAAPFAPDGV